MTNPSALSPIDQLVEDLQKHCGIDLLQSPTTQLIVQKAKRKELSYRVVIARHAHHVGYTNARFFGKK